MAGETVITIIGNLTDEPELRTTSAGAQVASFTIASTPPFLEPQHEPVRRRSGFVHALLRVA